MSAVNTPDMGDLFDNQETISQRIYDIYIRVITDYHFKDRTDLPAPNPFPGQQLEYLFYQKCWIDTIQWHLEDQIRAYDIDPHDALRIKRKIDRLNQDRTDIVEVIDNCVMKTFENVRVQTNAQINTETPGWALDRLSILALKIYHMQSEVCRADAQKDHRERCSQKLRVLHVQRETLSASINQLFLDIANGQRSMRLYKQMKMYNDATLNPVLYKASK